MVPTSMLYIQKIILDKINSKYFDFNEYKLTKERFYSENTVHKNTNSVYITESLDVISLNPEYATTTGFVESARCLYYIEVVTPRNTGLLNRQIANKFYKLFFKEGYILSNAITEEGISYSYMIDIQDISIGTPYALDEKAPVVLPVSIIYQVVKTPTKNN